MPESGPFGFVRGAPSNGRPYRDPASQRPRLGILRNVIVDFREPCPRPGGPRDLHR
jgi:hypothetical protein